MAEGTGQALNAHGSSQQTGEKRALSIAMVDLQKETGNFACQRVTDLWDLSSVFCMASGDRAGTSGIFVGPAT